MILTAPEDIKTESFYEKVFLSILRWHYVRSDTCFAGCSFHFCWQPPGRSPRSAHPPGEAAVQGTRSVHSGGGCAAKRAVNPPGRLFAPGREPGHAGPLHRLLYRLPGLGSGASLSAAAGLCKTSSQTPKARPDLSRSCGLLLTSSGFARVSLDGFLWNCS